MIRNWQQAALFVLYYYPLITTGYTITQSVNIDSLPPSFVRTPDDVAYIVPGRELFLPCEAKSNLYLTYLWLVNGTYVDWITEATRNPETSSHNAANGAKSVAVSPDGKAQGKVWRVTGEGTSIAGIYVCTVWNALGTVISNPVIVKAARNLIIQNINENHPKDPVTYWCEINVRETGFVGRGGKHLVTYHRKNMTQHYPPSIVKPSSDILIAAFNKPLSIKCFATGYPLPRIIWKLRIIDGWKTNWQEIMNVNMDGFQLQNEGTQLFIPAVGLKHEGSYLCDSAPSYAYSLRALGIFTVVIGGPPLFAQRPTDTNVSSGHTFSLLCSSHVTTVQNVPLKPTWSKNGVPIDGTHRDVTRVFAEDQELHFISVNYEDTGVYQCNLSNSHGWNITNAYVNVRPIEPRMERSMNSYEYVGFNRSTVLCCQVTGDPSPVVRWYFNGELLDVNESEANYQLRPNGDLHIKSAQMSNNGSYECRANNPFGQIKARGDVYVYYPNPLTSSMTVKIRQQETYEELPQLHHLDNNTILAMEKSNLQLNCVVSVDPRQTSELRITWRRNDERLTDRNNDRFSISKEGSVLTLNDLKMTDDGMYQCIASTEAETYISSVNILVVVVAKAEHKTNKTRSMKVCFQLGENSLVKETTEARTLLFKSPKNTLSGVREVPIIQHGIRGFAVKYRRRGEVSWKETPAHYSGTCLTLQNLVADADYEVVGVFVKSAQSLNPPNNVLVYISITADLLMLVFVIFMMIRNRMKSTSTDRPQTRRDRTSATETGRSQLRLDGLITSNRESVRRTTEAAHVANNETEPRAIQSFKRKNVNHDNDEAFEESAITRECAEQ